MTVPESELVQQALNGDAAAFRELVDRYKMTVHSIAYRICGNADDAYDISQTVFIRLYQSLSSYDPSRSLSAWLTRITANMAIDHRRKYMKRQIVQIDDVQGQLVTAHISSHPDKQTEHRELRGEIERVSQTLTDRQRIAFVLCDLQEYSTSETAQIMKCSESTVRVHLADARRQIRDELRKRYPDQFPGKQ